MPSLKGARAPALFAAFLLGCQLGTRATATAAAPPPPLRWPAPAGCDDPDRFVAQLPAESVGWLGFRVVCVAQAEDGSGPVAVLKGGETLALTAPPADDAPLGTGFASMVRSWLGVGGGAGPEASHAGSTTLLARVLAWIASKPAQTFDDSAISASTFAHPTHPAALFTAAGQPIIDDAGLFAARTAYWFQAGRWLWPGVKIGHVQTVIVSDGQRRTKELRLKTLALRPLVLEIDGFLDKSEAKAIQKMADKDMRRSGVVTMDSGKQAGQNDIDQSRTSTSTYLTTPTKVTERLETRAHNLTRLPRDLGEQIQVVRYEPGQKYEAHRDFFNPNDYVGQPAVLRSVDYGARNRLATVFWYLSSVAAGGETYFPRALNEHGREYHPWNYDFKDCYRGIAVKAELGKAIIFYSMLPNGQLDERSLHGGCPPSGDGLKWAANKWIWNHHPTFSGPYPKREAAAAASASACADLKAECISWWIQGQCEVNKAFMSQHCRKACGWCAPRERTEL